MKNYLKILIITLLIQVGCFGIGIILGNIENSLELTGVILYFVSFPISLVVDLILSIKWGKTIKEKLSYIFLMPTNYIWIIILIWIRKILIEFIDIFDNIPSNFG